MPDSPTLAPEPTTVAVTDSGQSAPAVSINEMSRPERDAFLKDGTVPDKKTTSADQPADAATAKPGEQAASTDATRQTASETVDPAKKKGKGAKERTAELDAEIRELNDRLRIRAELTKQLAASEPKPKPDAKEASSTTATETPRERYRRLAQHPDAPKAEDFDGDLDGYAASMAGFISEQVAKDQISAALTQRDQSRGQEAVQMRELEAIATRSADRIDAETAKDPTLAGKVHQAFKDLMPARLLPEGKPVGPHHYAKDLILFDSEHPLALSAFYSGSDEGIAEWNRLMTLSSADMQREIAYRDVSFRTSPAADPALKAKPFTKTPEPPAQMGTKPAGVVDKKKSAEGNFDAMLALLDAEAGTDTPRRGRRV